MSKRRDEPIILPGDFEERLADLLAVDPSGLHNDEDDSDDETLGDEDQATSDSDGSE